MVTEWKDRLWKRPWEEVTFYHQFRRDASGWIKDGDTIASIESVEVYDTAGSLQSGMITNQAVSQSTKVAWKVKGGSAGSTYEVKIRIVTTAGEKFEDHALLEVRSD